METSVYRVHHTSPQASQFIANVTIAGGSPITPKRVTHVIQELTLSSPSGRYSGIVKYPTSGPASIHIRHIDSDQKRLNSKRVEVAALRETIEKYHEGFQAYVKAQEREKEEQRQRRENESAPIYQWETCSRLAQAINDFLKNVIQATSPDSKCEEECKLARAQSIWDRGYGSRYLPHIYALWWVKAYEEDPTMYPLPLPLSNLAVCSPRSYNSYVTMPPLADHVATGVLALWESHWQPLLDLMLIFYIEQDEGRNFIQHPSPTRQFATAFIKTVPGLSDEDQVAASILIRLSSLEKDGILRPMFDLGDGLEADNVDDWERDLYLEMDKLYKGPLNESPQKKAKHDS